MNYLELHENYRVKSIQNRYLPLSRIELFLQSYSKKMDLQILGKSVEGRPIYKLKLGHGKIKILIWSQMHGNESTTTKGLLDFLNALQSSTEIAKTILEKYTLVVVPMLNPDGAERYSRVNANEVDLNRDFQNLSQPESKVLMQLYKEFEPDYCFNLHDQRTIFGAGASGKTATISFLAPSFNDSSEYNEARLLSVSIIIKMANALKEFIPGQIGRFDDTFNINCAGDTFQHLNTPTVLIEAGHFANDYQREETRKFVFIALLSGLLPNNENVIVPDLLTDYLNIPQNIPNYFDIAYNNVRINYDKSDIITNFAVQFKEVLFDDKIVFNAFIVKIGNLEHYYGHVSYDADGAIFRNNTDNIPKLNQEANFFLGKDLEIVNGLIKKY
jgi:hypothetical protein